MVAHPEWCSGLSSCCDIDWNGRYYGTVISGPDSEWFRSFVGWMDMRSTCNDDEEP